MNKSQPNNDTYYYYEDYADFAIYDAIGGVTSFILFFVITILNTIVLVILIRRRRRKHNSRERNRLHFFIIHLAVADLLVGGVCVLGDGIESRVKIWYLGNLGCKLYRFLTVVLLCASNNLLIGMSVDRFLAVKFPLRTLKSSIPLGRLFVAGAWGLSVMVSMFFPFYAHGEEAVFGCELHFPQHWWKPYITTVAVVIYIVPTLAISGCYIGICIIVWRNWRKGLGMKTPHITVIQANGQPAQKVSERGVHNGLLPKAKMKSIKMTFSICLAFLLCWTPYFVYNLLDVYGIIPMDIGRSTILGKLYPLNSAVNPLIFIIFNWQLFSRRKRFTQSDVPRTLYTSRSTTSLNVLTLSNNNCVHSLSSSNQTLASGV